MHSTKQSSLDPEMSIDDGLLPEDFVTTSHQDEGRPSESSRRWHSSMLKCANFGRKMLQAGVDLCHINYRQRLHPDIKTSDPLWSDAGYYFYYYVAMKLIVVIYYQYLFNYHKYKLDRFDEIAANYKQQNPSPSVTEDRLAQFRMHLVGELRDAKLAAKAFGAPHVNLNHVTLNLYIVALVLTPFFYLQPQYGRPLALSIIHLILAPEQMQPPIDLMIRNRVNSFIASSRTFSKACSDRIISADQRQFCSKKNQQLYEYNSSLTRYSFFDDEERAQQHRTMKNHRFLVEQVKRMAANGQLQPFNRRKSWLQATNIYCSIVYILLAPSAPILLLLYAIYAPRLLGAKVESGFMDSLFLTELFTYTAIFFSCGVIYILSLVAMCIDQMHLVSKLCEMIDNCIIDNNYHVINYLIINRVETASESERGGGTLISSSDADHPNAPTKRRAWTDHSIDEVINVPLMRIILHYKIFVKQVGPRMKNIEMYILTSLVYMFGPMIIQRLLIAYLDRQQQRMSICSTAVLLIAVDFILVFVCSLHERYLDIYKRLQRLMAHAVDMDHLSKMLINRVVYDEHLVQMLRRELEHPDRMTDQFSTRLILGRSNMTYAALMDWHFWWGLLGLSIALVDFSLPNSRDIFGGAWRFYGRADALVGRFFSNLTV